MANSRTLKDRPPAKRDLQSLFLMTVFPIHTWATLVFFHQLPSYLLKMSLSRALVIFAYALVYILLESILVSGILLIISLALPSLYHNRWIAQNAIIFFAIFVAFLPTQFDPVIIDTLPQISNYYSYFRIIWLIVVFSIIIGLTVLIRYNEKAVSMITEIVDRMKPLSYGYLGIDLISIIIVVGSIINRYLLIKWNN